MLILVKMNIKCGWTSDGFDTFHVILLAEHICISLKSFFTTTMLPQVKNLDATIIFVWDSKTCFLNLYSALCKYFFVFRPIEGRIYYKIKCTVHFDILNNLKVDLLARKKIDTKYIDLCILWTWKCINLCFKWDLTINSELWNLA